MGAVDVIILHPLPGPAAGPLERALAETRAERSRAEPGRVRRRRRGRPGHGRRRRARRPPVRSAPARAARHGPPRPRARPPGVGGAAAGDDQPIAGRSSPRRPRPRLGRSPTTATRRTSLPSPRRRVPILARLPREFPTDNALPRWLAEVGGVPVADLRRRWRLAVDLDSPLDAILVAAARRPGRSDPTCRLSWADRGEAVVARIERRPVDPRGRARRARRRRPDLRGHARLAGALTRAAGSGRSSRSAASGRRAAWRSGRPAGRRPAAHGRSWRWCSSATARRRSEPGWPSSATAHSSTPGSCWPTGWVRTRRPGRDRRRASRRTCSMPTAGRRSVARGADRRRGRRADPDPPGRPLARRTGHPADRFAALSDGLVRGRPAAGPRRRSRCPSRASRGSSSGSGPRSRRPGRSPSPGSWSSRSTTRSSATTASPAERPGRAGDFLTAPETHPIFGAAIARQLDEVYRRLGSPAPVRRPRVRRRLGDARPDDPPGARRRGPSRRGRRVPGAGPGDPLRPGRDQPPPSGRARRAAHGAPGSAAPLELDLGARRRPCPGRSSPTSSSTRCRSIASSAGRAAPRAVRRLGGRRVRRGRGGPVDPGARGAAGGRGDRARGRRPGGGLPRDRRLGRTRSRPAWSAGRPRHRLRLPGGRAVRPGAAGGTLLRLRRPPRHDDWAVAVGRQDLTAHVDFSAVERAAGGGRARPARPDEPGRVPRRAPGSSELLEADPLGSGDDDRGLAGGPLGRPAAARPAGDRRLPAWRCSGRGMPTGAAAARPRLPPRALIRGAPKLRHSPYCRRTRERAHAGQRRGAARIPATRARREPLPRSSHTPSATVRRDARAGASRRARREGVRC